MSATQLEIMEALARDWRSHGRECRRRAADYGEERIFCFYANNNHPTRRLGVRARRYQCFIGETFNFALAIRTIERLLDMEPPGRKVEGSEIAFEDLLFYMANLPKEDPMPSWWRWEFGFKFRWRKLPAVLLEHSTDPQGRVKIARRKVLICEEPSEFAYDQQTFKISNIGELAADISPWEG